MSGERDIVDELQFRVNVTRVGGQHTVREVMSDIIAMENARTEIERLRAAGDALDSALEASWQACWCSADDDIASKVSTAFNAWQEVRRD